MKTFRFKGIRQIEEDFIIEVDAETLEEAQSMIDEGDFDEFGHQQSYVDGSEEIEFDEEVGDDDSDDDDQEYDLGGSE